MKTTVDISDELLQRAKRYAADRDLTLKQAIEAGLRRLMDAPEARKPYKMKKYSFGSGGMVKDFAWPELRDIIYEGRGA